MYLQRIRNLEQAHAALDKQIDIMVRTGVYEDTLMQTLKKQRLAIKDQLQQLRRRQWEHDHETINMDEDR